MRSLGLIAKRICLIVWIAIPITSVAIYIYDPGLFTADNIVSFLRRFETEILIVYLAISITRGLTLLPSTPLVVAGTILFPNDGGMVLLISMLGILASSSLIYDFSEYLGFSEYFEKRSPEQTHKIRRQLEKPLGSLFVFLWAFFPFVPTDAVCYVAGTIRMTFWKFILAVMLGELVLCSFYIFSGRHFLRLLT